MTRIVSFVVLLAILLLVCILFYRVMATFLLPLFLAALLAVIFRPVHHWIEVKCKERKHVAAGLTTSAILLIVLLPLITVTAAAIQQGIDVAVTFPRDRTAGEMNQRIESLRKRFGLELPHGAELRRVSDAITDLDTTMESITLESDVGQLPFTQLPKYELRYQLDTLKTHINELRAAIAEDMAAGDGVGDEEATDTPNNAGELDSDTAEDSFDADGQTEESSVTLASMLEDPDLFLSEFSSYCTAISESLNDEPAPTATAIRSEIALLDSLFRRFRHRLIVQYEGALKGQIVDFANSDVMEVRWWQDKALKYLRSDSLQNWAVAVTGATTARVLAFLFGLVIMTIALYYFLAEGSDMIKAVMRLSPLDDRYEEKLIVEFDQVSRAVVLATLLSAIAQGILGGIGYWFAGLPSVLLLTMLTMFLALVPFIGAAAVWVPACLWLAAIEGRMLAAILLAVYGLAIISMADNVVKPMVLHGQSRLHPLLALLSVLGGVQALGPIGILIGPMVVSFLQALLNILHLEIVEMEKIGKQTA